MKRLGLSICATILLGTSPAWAQPTQPRPDSGLIIINPRDTLRKLDGPIQLPPIEWIGRPGMRQELVEAERFAAQGRWQDVVDFLQPVWNAELESNPDEAIGNALKRAYRSLKDYLGLRNVLRQELSLNPQNPIVQAELAEVFLSDNMTDSGRITLERMIAAGPQDRERYHLAAQTYMRVGRSNEGFEIYAKAREVLKDSALFAEEMARMYEARREYASAIDEYFRWLTAQPESQRQVQKQITNLVKIPEAAGQITAAVQRIVRTFPKHEYAHRLYGDLLFESGQPDSAFGEYRRADELSNRPGQHRLFGIERALETKHFVTARAEAMAFLADYPQHSDGVRVRLALARAELLLGNAELAVSMLSELASQIPNESEKSRILYEVGEIYRRYTNLKDSARASFMAVIKSPTPTPEKTASWLRIGEIEIYEGDLTAADSAFKVAANNPPQNLREEVDYLQAELLFLSGNFADCSAKLQELITEHPRGLYVNDAIAITAMIQDGHDEMDWSLKHFAAGLLLLRRENRDSALAEFAVLAGDTTNPLADDAQLATGRVLEANAEFEAAVDAYRAVVMRFPESFLVPRAWARIGGIYADSISDPAQARAAFQVILSDYKLSPVVEEARRRLQTLPVPNP